VHACVSVGLAVFLSYVARDYWVNLVISNSAERGWGLSAIAREGGLRLTGTFLDPTAFGLYCSIGTILSVSGLLYLDSPWRRRLMMLSAAICALGSLLSLSRGAWVLMIVGFATLGILNRQLAKFLAIAAAIAVIGSVAIGGRFGLPEVDVILDTWTKTVSEGNVQRESSWQETVTAVRSQPLGFGLGTVGHVGERFREQSTLNPPEITDGWYLKMLAEGGVPLFFAFIVFQGVAIVSIALRLRAPESAASVPFLSGVVAVLVGTLVQAVASNTWDLFFVAQVLWLLVGAGQAERPSVPAAQPRRGAS
jgi:O-antigen ligase